MITQLIFLLIVFLVITYFRFPKKIQASLKENASAQKKIASLNEAVVAERIKNVLAWAGVIAIAIFFFKLVF